MTGPEHYLEAERLLAVADRDVSENWPSLTGERKSDIIAAAKVHADLAKVAVALVPHQSMEVRAAWDAVTTAPPAAATDAWDLAKAEALASARASWVPAPPPPDAECCASGSCEVCRA